MRTLHFRLPHPLRISYCIPLVWAIPSCLGGETCSISQGATTISAFCEAGCCSSACCKENDTAGLSTTAIVMGALLGVIAIICIIIASIYFYRKKRPRCCYRGKEVDETDNGAKEFDNRRQSTDTLIVTNANGKMTRNHVLGDESSSGYSSAQSFSENKRPVARPASPFRPKDFPVAPPMTLPRSTLRSSGRVGLNNPAFEREEDKTEVLVMKKQKSLTSKTVTFKSRIDSPKGTTDPLPLPLGKTRPVYPPILPPLSKQVPNKELEFDHQSISETTDKSSSNKTNKPFDQNENAAKNMTTRQNRGGHSSNIAEASISSQIDNDDKIIVSKSTSPTRTRTSVRWKDNENSKPTLVQAASSNNSVDSIDLEDIDDKGRIKSGVMMPSPYLTEPYNVRRKKRANNILFSSPQTFSQQQDTNQSGAVSNDSVNYVSSFMRNKSGGHIDDSLV